MTSRLSPGSWADALSDFREIPRHYPRSLRSPGAPNATGIDFPTFLKQIQVQSAGIIQLHPIRLLQTGQERSCRNTSMHGLLSRGTSAPWAPVAIAGCGEGSGSECRGSYNAGIVLWSGLFIAFRERSPCESRGSRPELQISAAQPFLTQIHKRLVGRAIHL